MLRSAAGITYTFTHKRVKNINLRVRAGKVWVSAPLHSPPAAADEFVARRAQWIQNALQQQARQQTAAPMGSLYYQGQLLTVQVHRGNEAAQLQNSTLHIWVYDPQEPLQITRAAEKWCRAQIQQLFPRALAEARAALAAYTLPEYTLRVRSMKSRWGSCHTQKHVVTLNTRLLEYPYACLRYVAMHELCHFIHADHSAAFYTVLAEIEPQWAALRKRLRAGPAE